MEVIKMKTISVELSRDQLCLIQQALGLRESVLINTIDFYEGVNRVLQETILTRSYVVSHIRKMDKQKRVKKNG